MTRILMFVAATAACLCASAARPLEAAAAPMSYCETWAERVAGNSPEAGDPAGHQAVRDKSFYACLNMDEEPPLPAVAQGLHIDPSGSPFRTLDAPPVERAPGSATTSTFSAPEQPAIEETASEQPVAQGDSDDGDLTGGVETVPAGEDDGQGRGSGKPRGSEAWATFCAKYYPNSFDRETGTVVPAKLGRRVPCR